METNHHYLNPIIVHRPHLTYQISNQVLDFFQFSHFHLPMNFPLANFFLFIFLKCIFPLSLFLTFFLKGYHKYIYYPDIIS